MKAVIYCRVSTKEQAEHGFSLVAQERECRKYILENGYTFGKIFIERGESAKTQDRTQLTKLIQYAIKNKNNVEALIIWKFDRLARNLSDQTELVKSFSKLQIRTLSVTEDNSESATGNLMRNIIGSFAQFENDIKSERTISGMQQATKEGYWCSRAPLGFKFKKDDSGRAILENTEDSVYIKEVFELAEKGIYKQTEIVQKMKMKGFKKINSSNHLRRILRNPLYAGLIKVTWFDDYIEGKHKAIVSKKAYHKVNFILDGKNPNIVPHVNNNPDFPLRAFVKCSHCESKYTGSWSKGRSKKYPYYHCRGKGCSASVRKEVIEEKFRTLLEELEPDDKVLNLFAMILIDVWKVQKKESIELKKTIENDIDKLIKKQNRIDELVIEGTFNSEDYARNSKEIKSEILLKELQLGELNNDENDVKSMICYCKFFLSNLSELWINADINLKQRFQKLIFPVGIYFDGKKFRTAVTNIVFGYLRKVNTQSANMASPRGIEPLLQE